MTPDQAKDSTDCAAARLRSAGRMWADAQQRYIDDIAAIRSECPHEHVNADAWQYGVIRTCRDCGATIA